MECIITGMDDPGTAGRRLYDYPQLIPQDDEHCASCHFLHKDEMGHDDNFIRFHCGLTCHYMRTLVTTKTTSSFLFGLHDCRTVPPMKPQQSVMELIFRTPLPKKSLGLLADSHTRLLATRSY